MPFAKLNFQRVHLTDDKGDKGIASFFVSCLPSEIQKKHEQLTRKEEGKVKFIEKLTSRISEELQKGTFTVCCLTNKIFSAERKLGPRS